MKCIAIVFVLVALAGCGSSSGGSSTSGASSASDTPSAAIATTVTAPSGHGPIQVTIKTLAFNPDAISAKVGQTVNWINEDGPLHNVTYVSGPLFKSSRNLKTGQKFALKLTHAGTIEYLCSVHPFMKAKIIVNP